MASAAGDHDGLHVAERSVTAAPGRAEQLTRAEQTGLIVTHQTGLYKGRSQPPPLPVPPIPGTRRCPMTAPRKATIGDVARHAGVSKGTVSLAYSGKRPVSEETR